MLELFPGATVLAFPRGGPGTANCIAQALGRGMRVVER
jgi:predicted phosphoribosyltransferase